MGLRREPMWAVEFKVLVVVAVLAEYGVSGVWGQLPSQAGWLNIDCGSLTPYTDPTTSINWVPDTPYITTGKVVTVNASVAFAEGNSLRSFPDAHAKSCYTLPVKPNDSYLLRATFFYAGYDNAPNPPEFSLAVDGTVFDSVTGKTNIGTWREVLFVAAGNVTSFCLVRDVKSNTVPFISAISLKPYVNAYAGIDVYLAQKQIIVTEQRVNFGGDKLIRYPDDPIDRYWFAQPFNTSYLKAAAPLEVISTTEPIANVDNSFYVPWPVLQTGVQLPTPGNVTLMPLGGSLADDEILKKTQICMHFAELDPLANVTSREFTISVPSPQGPVLMVENPFNFTAVPQLYTANTWNVPDVIDLGPSTAITFSSSPTSVRGPIINGLEVFLVLQPANASVTAPRDVLAIEAIKMDMNLTEWTGDPCAPVPHNWLNCTLDVPSKLYEVTNVDLSRYNLTGTISPSFAKLEALISLSLANNALTGPLPDLSTLVAIKTLQLENNALTGPLPRWLASIKSMSKLSVENNNFSGEIPPGLVGVNSLDFTYQPGNPDLHVGSAIPSSPTSSKSNIGIIIGAVVGGLVGLAALVGLILGCCIYASRTKAKRNTQPGGRALPEIAGANAFSFAQVAAFTNNFKRKIGSGGFGPVYYGRLPSGQEVAVKVADSSSQQGAAEFYNEVELMSRVHHRNLVPLVGYCQEGANQILIYEYVDMGSLHDHLFGTSSSRNVEPLNWNKRLNIAVNAAQGLEYLHAGCIPGIIHRDVKTSNILLTSKSEIAKVADFGLSKLTSDENATHVSTLVKGTRGYLDPEYFQTNCLTYKSDVFSFGVVLLELLTGQPPVSTNLARKSAGNLVDWVRENLSAGDMNTILDPTVKASNPNLDGLWKVAEVAMNCVEPKGAHRPTMSEVVQDLRAALALEPTNHVEYHSEPSSNLDSAFLAESMPSCIQACSPSPITPLPLLMVAILAMTIKNFFSSPQKSARGGGKRR